MSSNTPESFTSEYLQDNRTQQEIRSHEAPLRLAVLLSGSGSNLQALIDAIESKQLPGVEIALVVSNKPNAHGLQRALKHTLPTIYLPWEQPHIGAAHSAQFIAPTPNPSIATVPITTASTPTAPQHPEMPVGAQFIAPTPPSEAQLTSLLYLFQIDLIVLAGWMRILSAPFLAQFPRRVINLHPALIPDNGTGSTYTTKDGNDIPVFRGLHAVRQALDAGVRITGSTVHYVTPEVDAGPVICREEVIIERGDTEESLHARIKAVEHRLIVEAIKILNHQTLANKLSSEFSK